MPHYKRHGTLHCLELSYAPWDSISMNFITQLPKSTHCLTVWVIVDQFDKMVHFVPIKGRQKTAEGCTKLFLQNILKLHGLASRLISDRDPVFTTKFRAELMRRLDIWLRKYIAFYPQTDGQTERVNQSLEKYLCHDCNHEQDNWYNFLPLVEYAYNNSATMATQISFFYVNYGSPLQTTCLVETNPRTLHPETMSTGSRVCTIFAVSILRKPI